MYSVTICVPIYKVEKYIERCVRSVFEQTYENLEYIFVDDNSPDKSIAILNKIIAQYPRRKEHVKIIKHKVNRGLAAARNTAVANCNTMFIMHIDSDDWIDTNVVEKLVTQQIKTDADIVAYDVKMHFPYKIEIRHKPQCKNPDDLLFLLLHRQINCGVWGALIRTSLYKSNRIEVLEGINMSEDFQVYPRLIFFSRKVTTLNGVYYHYNFSNQNSYTHNETFSTCAQVWMTYDILESFFSDKGTKYVQALKEGKKKAIARQLLSGCLHETGREIYTKVHEMLNDLQDVVDKDLNIHEKLAIKINSFTVLKVYSLVILLLKKIICYIKSISNQSK